MHITDDDTTSCVAWIIYTMNSSIITILHTLKAGNPEYNNSMYLVVIVYSHASMLWVKQEDLVHDAMSLTGSTAQFYVNN